MRLEIVTCESPRQGRSDDEERLEPTLSFTWSGWNVRHKGRASAVASAASVLFADAGEIYSVSHPCGSGEVALNLIVAPETLREILGPTRPEAVVAQAPCDASLYLAQR